MMIREKIMKKITKRELIVCIAVIALWICATVGIDYHVTQRKDDEAIQYEQAVQIKSPDMFKHAINTRLGDILTYGQVKTVDPVGYLEIGKKYMSASWIKEEYKRHTRTVYHSNGKGGTYTTTETYYSWDEVNEGRIASKDVKYLGQEIPTIEIHVNEEHIKTVQTEPDVRFKYYGVPKNFKATMFIHANGKANVKSTYKDENIKEVVQSKWNSIKTAKMITWITSMILMCIVIGVFVYRKNKWLND
jgi:hypothetical protein